MLASQHSRLRLQFLVLLMMGAVTPETCRVILQLLNICILLHLVGFLLTMNYDARNRELKSYKLCAICPNISLSL